MTEPVKTCPPVMKAMTQEVERILEIILPDCAAINITENGGIRAVGEEQLGTVSMVEVDRNGNYSVALFCGEQAKKIKESCIEIPKTQGGSVGLDKLKRARGFILHKRQEILIARTQELIRQKITLTKELIAANISPTRLQRLNLQFTGIEMELSSLLNELQKLAPSL